MWMHLQVPAHVPVLAFCGCICNTMHSCRHVCAPTYMCVWWRIYMCMHVSMCVQVCICMCMCMLVRVHMSGARLEKGLNSLNYEMSNLVLLEVWCQLPWPSADQLSLPNPLLSFASHNLRSACRQCLSAYSMQCMHLINPGCDNRLSLSLYTDQMPWPSKKGVPLVVRTYHVHMSNAHCSLCMPMTRPKKAVLGQIINQI